LAVAKPGAGSGAAAARARVVVVRVEATAAARMVARVAAGREAAEAAVTVGVARGRAA